MGMENISSNTRKRLRRRVTEKNQTKRKAGYILRVYIQKGERSKVRTKSMSMMGKESLGDSKGEKKHEKLRGRLLNQENADKVCLR